MYVLFGFLHMGEVVTPTACSYDPATHLCFGDFKVDTYENPEVTYSKHVEMKVY